MTLRTIIIIGSGGFIGAVSRAYLTGVFHKVSSWHGIAMGTLGVNILGSLLMGLLFAFFTHTTFFSPTMKSFLATGLLGALTTYSTFALENFIMLQAQQYGNFFLNISANVIGTLLAVTLGFTLMSLVVK